MYQSCISRCNSCIPHHALCPQTMLDEVSITLNKNSVPGDKSAVVPGGIRIGTPALTTRGFKEADFVQVADFIHRSVTNRDWSHVTLMSELNPSGTLGDTWMDGRDMWLCSTESV